MPVDLSSINDFLPIITFLIVWILVYALLMKTKVVDNLFIELFLSFLVASIFITVSGARDLVLNVTPWFGVLVVCFVFILAIIGFGGKEVSAFFGKGIGVAFVIVLIVIFVISAISVFSSPLGDYYDKFLSYPKLTGGLLLVVVGAVVSWILVKVK